MNLTSKRTVIGVAGPSDNMLVAVPMMEQAVGHLKEAGFEVRVAENILMDYGRFAGEHKLRAEHFMKMATMKDAGHLLMATGGYGALHMLNHLDFARMSREQVWVGFSDSSVLLNARVAKTGVGGWHGFMLKQLAKGFESHDRALVREILAGNAPQGYGADVLKEVRVLKAGKVTGRLMGGNVAAFRSLMGTPFAPTPQEGDILFLEELDDDLCRVDRDLHHLAQAGWFEKLGGLIYGNFSEMHESTSRPFGFTLDEVFANHAAKVKGPVVANFPVGHVGTNLPLPVGSVVTLEAGKNVTLTFEGVK